MTIELGPAHLTPGGRYGKGSWRGLPFAPDDTVERYITSEFGAWEDFRQKLGWKPHAGTDIHAGIGTPLHALGPGDVEMAGRSGAFPVAGNYVQIHHGSGLRTAYLHMDSVAIELGQRVERGQFIGTAGKTSSMDIAPHLHLSVSQDDEGDPLTGGRHNLDPALTVVRDPSDVPADPWVDPADAGLDKQTFEEAYVSHYWMDGAAKGGTSMRKAPEFLGFQSNSEEWMITITRPKDERPGESS